MLLRGAVRFATRLTERGFVVVRKGQFRVLDKTVCEWLRQSSKPDQSQLTTRLSRARATTGGVTFHQLDAAPTNARLPEQKVSRCVPSLPLPPCGVQKGTRSPSSLGFP
ncbi:hypothetical protein PCANC_03681 [Puccinia coronata f. sp. avenae]|uniref:Uncharacterized protein n=1 Tax=Puccinia coronata f. sp. avenae TaxID=200324 RepID=A0A2N5VXL6_9BASI|nr:hypothetical protein PCANC_03681 [Puccinia coronata f. sp. avenae]